MNTYIPRRGAYAEGRSLASHQHSAIEADNIGGGPTYPRAKSHQGILPLIPHQSTYNMIKPLQNRALVKPLPPGNTTTSGIIVSLNEVKDEWFHGTVVAVGDGDEIKRFELRPGDVVVYQKYAGQTVSVDGEEHKLLNTDCLLAVVEQTDNNKNA